MPELLQKLWDEYALLIQALENITDTTDELTPAMRELCTLIMDTDGMKKLRTELTAAGVKINVT